MFIATKHHWAPKAKATYRKRERLRDKAERSRNASDIVTLKAFLDRVGAKAGGTQ